MTEQIMTDREKIELAAAQADKLRKALWDILYWDQENVIPDELHKAATAAIWPQQPDWWPTQEANNG